MALNYVRALHQRFDNERFDMFVSWLVVMVQHTGQQEIQPFTFLPSINQTMDMSIADYDQLPQATLLNLDAPALQQTKIPEGLVTSRAEYPAEIASSDEEVFQPSTLVGDGPWQCMTQSTILGRKSSMDQLPNQLCKNS
ncbi:hypothetical protein CSKR_201819 [Clonorchis sinensis]|uniref:Uncharacterized protein n=1 Tax=Clonorchis sinensis TaxID=79923 RepID=A0A8T1MXY1_CLOSI|nr:hypothetical protein CSKR_201819 [Clonorchis sinensis]